MAQLGWYELLYLIGARVIRFSRKSCRHLQLFFRRFRWAIRLWISDRQEQRKLFPRKSFWAKRKALFHETVQNLKRPPGTARLHALQPIARMIGRMLNWVFPVFALVLLLKTVLYFGGLTYALRVEYNGQYVGYISNESDFVSAEAQVLSRIIGGQYHRPESDIPQYTFEVIEEEQLTPLPLLANNMIAASGNAIEEAAGLYVNDQFIGAVIDGDALLAQLKDKKTQERTEYPQAEVSFVQKIRLTSGLYPVSSVIPLSQIMQTLNAKQGKTTLYQIKPGDAPYTIAQEFEIPLQTIFDLNPEVTQHMLVGDELILQKPAPFLQKQVVEMITEKKEIFYETETEIDQNKESTYKKVIQQGQNGLKEIMSRIVLIDGTEADREVVQETILREKRNQKVVLGSLRKNSSAPGQASGGEFQNASTKNLSGYIWPLATHHVICSFYGYANHHGVDIGAGPGTAIWAAKGGTVTYANWSRGYGYNVLIDHGDGTKTRYAHCSALLVNQGQTVAQGQQVAQVGRTGNASTEHCHFEIIQNGRFLDAQAVIG